LNSKPVFFPCGDIQLEGVLHLPERNGPFPIVIVCHPHPLYGGDMDNNVVMAVCSALVKNSIAALRFNFRGVGNSGGNYSEGFGEQDDLRAALDFLSTLKDVDSERIGLAGYSFGGMVALAVAVKDNRVKQLALISPALQEEGWEQLRAYTLPKLILVGDNDTSVTYRPFRRFFGDARHYQVIAGVDHFWVGFEPLISDKIARFFNEDFPGKKEV
jgi:uncharacterized protein